MAQRKVLITVEVEDGQAEARVKKLVNAFDQLDEETGRAGTGLKSAFLQADLAARGVAVLTREVMQGVQEYLKYNRELANLNTLLDDSSQADKFRQGLVRLDPALGETSELARGMYQAISSGVDAGEGLDFITVSAKAARAGLATTFETVDAGTTIINSFKLAGKDATMVYDKMFEVVKRGKIEMPQLAQSIGLVSNIAAQTGVTLDEMFAVIATASTTIRPAQAIEGFRTLLANILKPSEQAMEVARRLGVEFSEDALRSKGFAKFLNDITTAAGGNKEALARLFGDVQALNVVMAITGNRAENLANDLKGIAAASGTVEVAFQKQKQSVESQLTQLKVTVQQSLIKTFMLIEPLLTGVLSLVNRYPAVFGAAAVAVGGLVAAHLLWNTQLLITASTYIPQLIANLRNLITVMFAFNQVSSLSATGMAAFATGWAGLALAIGIVIYALASYDSAAEAANKLTLEQIENQAKAYESSRQMAAAVKEVAAAQEGSAERHEKLNAILGQLDPATRTYIEALKDEKQQLAAVSAEVQKLSDVKKAEVEASLRAAGAGVLEQQQAIRGLEDEIKVFQARIREASADLNNADPTRRFFARKDIEAYNAFILDASDRLKEFRKELGENETKLLAAARALGYNRDQLIAFFRASGQSAEGARNLADVYDKLTPKIDSTNKVLEQQVLTIDGVRNALKALKEVGEFEIERKILDIVNTAKSAAEAKKLAHDALKGDNTFRDLVERRKLNNAAEKAAREVFEPSDRTRRDRGDAVQSTTDDVRKLRAEVEALQRNGGVLYKLKIDKADLEQTKSDLENILKLRHQLTLPLTTALPKDLAGIREETRVLNEQKKIVDAVIEAKTAQSTAEFELARLILTSTLPLVSAETRAQKLYTQGVRDRANAELDLTAQLNAAVRLRRDALKSEQETLRETRQQYTQLRLDAVKAAEDARLADIRSQIEFAVAFGKEPELQDRLNRLQAEMNKESDKIKPPIVEMNINVKKIVDRLQDILGALSGKSGGTTAAGAASFNAAASLPLIRDFLRSIGAENKLRAVGQGNVHNRFGLDHRNAIDVAINPASQEGQQLRRFLEAQGIPFSAFKAGTKTSIPGLTLTPHFHIGELSQRTGEKHPVGSLLQAGAQQSTPTPPPVDEVVRTDAFGAALNLAETDSERRRTEEITRQRDAITNLQRAEEDLRQAREAEMSLRKQVLEMSGKTLEQLSIEAALEDRERLRIKEDLAAATAAGVVEHDLALARGRDAEYVQRVTVDAERARSAAAKSTTDELIADEAYLFQLQSGNAEATRRLYEQAAAARVQAHISLYGEIAKLEDEIAHVGEDAAQRHKLAWLQAIRGVQEASEQAAISQIQSQVKLKDATVFHADQANARVLEFLASQKSVTESIADFRIGLIKGGFDEIDRGFQKLIGSGNIFKKLLADLLANLTKLFLSRLFADWIARGQGNAAGASGGGGGGNILGSLLNLFQPGGGGGSNSSFSIPGGFAGGAGAGNFLSVDNSLTPARSLTEQLQQQATLSSVLHEAGHSLPATTASTSVTSGRSASVAGAGLNLKSLVASAPLVGALFGAATWADILQGHVVSNTQALLGGGLLGFLLNRNTARRRDERTRTQGINDSLAQLQQILAAVRTDRMDGGQAIASAMQVRSEYVSAMSALKDKKTREIALKDVSRLDLVIAQIRGQAELQLKRQAIDEKLVPEFDSGGFTPNSWSLIKVRPHEVFLPPGVQEQLARNGGFIPGPDYGRDNTFMMAPPNSLVLPQRKAPTVRMPSLSSSTSSGSFSGGGSQSSSQQPPTLSIGQLLIQAAKIEVDQDAGKIVATGLKMVEGKDAYWREYKEGRDEGRLRS